MTQPISGVTFPASRPATGVERPRGALIRCRAGCVEGQCGGEIGEATWQEEAERDHFLTLSLIHLSFSSGHSQYGLVISHGTDGC